MPRLLPALSLLIAVSTPTAADDLLSQLFAAASPRSVLPEGCDILGPIEPRTRWQTVYQPGQAPVSAKPEIVFAVDVLRDAWRNERSNAAEMTKDDRECIIANIRRYPGINRSYANEVLTQVAPCGKYQCPSIESDQQIMVNFGMVD